MRKVDIKLFNAIIEDDIDAVKAAIAEGANVEAQNPESSNGSPLHAAAMHSTRSIQILVDAGADIFVTDSAGYQPVDFATNEGKLILKSIECSMSLQEKMKAKDVYSNTSHHRARL